MAKEHASRAFWVFFVFFSVLITPLRGPPESRISPTIHLSITIVLSYRSKITLISSLYTFIGLFCYIYSENNNNVTFI